MRLVQSRQTLLLHDCEEIRHQINPPLAHGFSVLDIDNQHLFKNLIFNSGAARGPHATLRGSHLYRLSPDDISGAKFLSEGRTARENLYEVKTWTRLDDHYGGTLGHRGLNFWTSLDMERIFRGSAGPDMYNAVGACLLRLGFTRAFEKYLLLRIDVSESAHRAHIPTELDAYPEILYCPADIRMGASCGYTVRVSKTGLRRGTREYVIKNLPVSSVSFVGIKPTDESRCAFFDRMGVTDYNNGQNPDMVKIDDLLPMVESLLAGL